MQPSTFTHTNYCNHFSIFRQLCMQCGLSNLKFRTLELANLGHFSGSHSLTFTVITEPQQHILHWYDEVHTKFQHYRTFLSETKEFFKFD